METSIIVALIALTSAIFVSILKGIGTYIQNRRMSLNTVNKLIFNLLQIRNVLVVELRILHDKRKDNIDDVLNGFFKNHSFQEMPEEISAHIDNVIKEQSTKITELNTHDILIKDFNEIIQKLSEERPFLANSIKFNGRLPDLIKYQTSGFKNEMLRLQDFINQAPADADENFVKEVGNALKDIKENILMFVSQSIENSIIDLNNDLGSLAKEYGYLFFLRNRKNIFISPEKMLLPDDKESLQSLIETNMKILTDVFIKHLNLAPEKAASSSNQNSFSN